MAGRFAVLTFLAALAFAPVAHAEDFAVQHTHGGIRDASAEGSVTFPDAGGANVSVTVTDRDEDGWCAQAWVTSNLPPSTHRAYPVCGVAKQQTFTLALPATARCDVTFVEVQVGRIYHHDDGSTSAELGESKRMANPCPPVAVPTPVPTPAPVVIDAKIRHAWVANRRWTRNTTLQVRDVPPGATVTVRCRGRGCPTGRTRSLPVRNGRADGHRLLRRAHLRPGALVEVRVTAPGAIGKLGRLRIRRSRVPTLQTLCLPPGASPSRC